MRKAVISISVVLAVLVLMSCTLSVGFVLGQNFNAVAGVPGIPGLPASAPSASTSEDNDELFIPFWQAWEIVHKYYVDQPLDEGALMQGAIRGMVEALGDQHSSYQDPVEFKQASESLSGEYEGIGAWVNTDGEYLTISEPMPGSPAEKAGLLPGDLIVAIDGEDMTGVLPEIARQKVLGPKGSSVRLTISREGVENPFEVEVQRASIKVASVESKMLEGNIAYIKVRQFGDQTDEDLHKQLEELMAQKPTSLILDLRNNPGGLLRTAVTITSEFLPDGVVLYEEYGDGTREVLNVEDGGLATDIPMVVLVNEYSASASEVLAGALQDRGRATLLGETTYGKGSVQQIIPLSNEQGAVRVTIARWLTPNERLINGIGLTPDVAVEMTDDDYANQLDPQLDAALDFLKEK